MPVCISGQAFVFVKRGENLSIDYYAYISKMKSWNAGFKVFISAAAIFSAIFLNSIAVSVFIVLTMSALTVFVGKTPIKIYIKLMTIPLTFMILSGATIAAQFSFNAIGDWYIHLGFFYLGATISSITTAVQAFFKAMAGMSALYMMSLSTPLNEFILVLQGLRLPKILAELMNLIYRYIFILFDVAENMQTAAKARLGYEGFFKSCKTFAGIGGNLFLISLIKAGKYYDAMVARGYDGTLEFLTEKHPVKMGQVISAFIYFSIIFAIAFVRRLL